MKNLCNKCHCQPLWDSPVSLEHFFFIFEPLFIVFGRTGEVKKSISIFVWSPNDSI